MSYKCQISVLSDVISRFIKKENISFTLTANINMYLSEVKETGVK